MTVDQVKALRLSDVVLFCNGALLQVIKIDERCCHFMQLEFPFDEFHVDFYRLTDKEADDISRMN